MRHEDSLMTPQIIDAAATWFVAMRDPTASPDVRKALAEWLRASPLNVRAYLEIASLWNDAARIDPACEAEKEIAVQAADRASNVLSFPTLLEQGLPHAPFRTRAGWRRFAGLAVAALVASMAVGIALWWLPQRSTEYRAAANEQRVITLEDGSVLRLNSRSRLQVHLTPKLREVELSEGGQALFEVAKDPSRPFIVHSGRVSVLAVGTAFDIRSKSSGTVVTVIEGRVRVDLASEAGGATLSADARGLTKAAPTTAASIGAGEQLTVTRVGEIERTAHANVAAVTSWLQRELIFDGEPLQAAVEEFNRYASKTIVIADPELAELRINAVFRSTSPSSLLRFVQRLDGVQVEESAHEIRIIRRRPQE